MSKEYRLLDEKHPAVMKMARICQKFYPNLVDANPRIDLVLVSDHDKKGEVIQALTHQGFGAAGVIRVIGLKDRAKGAGDAEIQIDECVWEKCTSAQQDSLLDHELYHLLPIIDPETLLLETDALGRPRLRLRKHDFQFGGFNEVIQRNGDDAVEILQARAVSEVAAQLFFGFVYEAKNKKAATT